MANWLIVVDVGRVTTVKRCLVLLIHCCLPSGLNQGGGIVLWANWLIVVDIGRVAAVV